VGGYRGKDPFKEVKGQGASAEAGATRVHRPGGRGGEGVRRVWSVPRGVVGDGVRGCMIHGVGIRREEVGRARRKLRRMAH
jgi:hypothetical protein